MSDSGTSSESDPDITCKQKPVVFDMNGIGPDAESSSEDPDLISFSYTSDEEFLPAMMKKKKTVNHHQSPFTTTNSPAMSSVKKKHENLRNKLSAHKSSVPPSSTSSIPPNLHRNIPSKISASMSRSSPSLPVERPKSEGLSTSQDMSATAAHVHGRHLLITTTFENTVVAGRKKSSHNNDSSLSPSPPPPHSPLPFKPHNVFESKKRMDDPPLNVEKKRRRLSSMNAAHRPKQEIRSESQPVESSHLHLSSQHGDATHQRLHGPHMMRHRGKISAMAGYKGGSLSPKISVMVRSSSNQSLSDVDIRENGNRSLSRSPVRKRSSPVQRRKKEEGKEWEEVEEKEMINKNMSNRLSGKGYTNRVLDNASDSGEEEHRSILDESQKQVDFCKDESSDFNLSSRKGVFVESTQSFRCTESVPHTPKAKGRPPKRKRDKVNKHAKTVKQKSKVPKALKKPIIQSSDSEEEVSEVVREMEEEEEENAKVTKNKGILKLARKLALSSSQTATSVLSSSLNLNSKLPSKEEDSSKSLEPDSKVSNVHGSLWGDSGYLKSSSSENSDSSSSGSDSEIPVLKNGKTELRGIPSLHVDESDEADRVQENEKDQSSVGRGPSVWASPPHSSPQRRNWEKEEMASKRRLVFDQKVSTIPTVADKEKESSISHTPSTKCQNRHHSRYSKQKRDSSNLLENKKTKKLKKKGKITSHISKQPTSPSPPPSPAPIVPMEVTLFTAAKLPEPSSGKSTEGRGSIKEATPVITSKVNDSKGGSLQRKRKMADIFEDSDSDSAEEKFSRFLEGTAQSKSRTASSFQVPKEHTIVKVKKGSGSKKKDNRHTNSKAKDKPSQQSTKNKKSSVKNGHVRPSKKLLVDNSNNLDVKTISLTSSASKKRPLGRDDVTNSSTMTDKKLRLVDIDFTGGKIKQQQTQRPQNKGSKLSRLQKLRIQSQKMHHGALQHTSHTFTNKGSSLPVAQVKVPKASKVGVVGLSSANNSSQHENTSLTPKTTSKIKTDATLSAVSTMSVMSNCETTVAANSLVKGLTAKPERTKSPFLNNASSNKNYPAKTILFENSDPIHMSASPSKVSPHHHKQKKEELQGSNMHRTSSPSSKISTHRHTIKDSTNRSETPSLKPSITQHRTPADAPGHISASSSNHRGKFIDDEVDTDVSSVKASSSTVTSSNSGGVVVSSTSSKTMISGGKVIHGEKKYYSPFPSRGKMMPLMNSGKSEEDEDEEEDEDDDDDEIRNSHQYNHYHHIDEGRGDGRNVTYPSRDSDHNRMVTSDNRGGGGDLYAQKDAILAAKFPQKRNYMPPGSLGGGAGGGKIVASRYHHHHY